MKNLLLSPAQVEAIEEIIANLLKEGLFPNELSAQDSYDQHFWLDVAKALGPDYCQALYHAAVFTTKVA